MIDFNTVPDEDLYSMCIEGDEGAWQYMYNYILAICRWGKWNLKDDPDDLAQDITMHFIEKAIKKVKESNKFRGFVKVTTINKVKDSFKSPRPEVSLDAPRKNKKGEDFIPEFTDHAPLHDSILTGLQTVHTIDAAVNKLSEICRKVVSEYLNFKLGLYKDYKELSKVLKMPVPTISSRVTRCLANLVEIKEIKALRA